MRGLLSSSVLFDPSLLMNVNAAEFAPPLHVLRASAPSRLPGGLDGAAILTLYQRRTLLLYLRAYSTSLSAGALFLLSCLLYTSPSPRDA